MAILTGLWCRLNNSLPWVCLSLFPLRGVARPGHELGSILQCRKDLYRYLCQGLVVLLWLRGLTWETGNEAHPSGKKSAGGSVPTSSANTRRKGVCGVSASDVSQSSASSSSSSAVFQVGMLFKFFINGEALHLTGLCLIWFWVTIFSLGAVLPCSVTSDSSMSR